MLDYPKLRGTSPKDVHEYELDFLRFDGKPVPTKKDCPDCGLSKPLEEFHYDRSRPLGLSRRCKVCANEYSAKYLAANKDRIKEQRKKKYQDKKAQ